MTFEMEAAARASQPESVPRHEERFIASEELARLAMRTAGSHLQLAQDDRPYQWSTTAYCDTYDWQVFRAAEAGQALRLRFREYHRTRPDQAFTSARVWLELKEDTVDMSRKERFEIAGDAVPAFLRGETELTDVSVGLGKKAAELVAGGAHPVVVTQYNRLAYAATSDQIRITADHNLIYLAVPWTTNSDDAVPIRIGPILARETDVVIEMKWFGQLPNWAEELHGYLRERAPADRPSKFVVAMRHLLGEAKR
ncbi:MAG: VTC domain-containing protein [Chloroflexota bacterium]|nr:VTC domain-containing protein [Chloroflexota bacterium]